MLTDLACALLLLFHAAGFFYKKCAASENIEKHRAVGFSDPRPGRPGVPTRREQVRFWPRFTKASVPAHAHFVVHTLSDESAIWPMSLMVLSASPSATPRSIWTPRASILAPRNVIVDPSRVIRSTLLDPSGSFREACGLMAAPMHRFWSPWPEPRRDSTRHDTTRRDTTRHDTTLHS